MRELIQCPPETFLPPAELDDTPIDHRIPDLLTTRGNLLLSSYRKVGKTSLALNLVGALTTDLPFLGGLPCKPLVGPVAYVNLDLPQAMLRQYYLDAGLKLDSELVLFQDYVGKALHFRLLDLEWRAEYAQRLWKEEAGALIIDSLPKVLACNGIDLNDNSEVIRGLEALSEIATDAQLSHVICLDSVGHSDKTRSRGASALEDWADVLWNIQADGEPGSPYRSLTTTGRGVSGHQRYMMQRRELVLASGPGVLPSVTQATTATARPGDKILAYMRRMSAPVTAKQIELATGMLKPDVAKYVKQALCLGQVKITGKAPGKGGAALYVIEDQF